MIKTIFFDFGNVLAFFDHWRAVRKLTAFTDMSGEALFAALYDSPLEHDFEHGRITTAEYVSRALAAGTLSCSHDQFLACFLDIFTPNHDVLDLIPDLAKDYRLVLASNTNDAHFTYYCREYQPWLKHFSALPTSHQAGHRKPTARFYDYCQRFAEAEPGECLFVDDIAANIAGGERHGWQGLHYPVGTSLQSELLKHLSGASR